MKELVKSSRVTGYLEKMYRQLNIDKFNGELEEPIITIMSTPRAYGHVTCGKVWKAKDSRRYELNIGAGTLDRPIENVVSTLLHEMVHIYHMQNDIQDTSRGNVYHNRKFKEKAESVGLVIEHHKTHGYTLTSPSDELILYIAERGWEDILINRSEPLRINVGTGAASGTNPDDMPKVKKPSSTRKYQCPNCGMSVRATKVVNIICGDCTEQMQVVD